MHSPSSDRPGARSAARQSIVSMMRAVRAPIRWVPTTMVAVALVSQSFSCDVVRRFGGGSVLRVGESITVEIRDEEPHWHRVRLDAGRLAELRVLQLGVDVIASVYDPDSKLLTEID